jgi:hypothetical protein
MEQILVALLFYLKRLREVLRPENQGVSAVVRNPITRLLRRAGITGDFSPLIRLRHIELMPKNPLEHQLGFDVWRINDFELLSLLQATPDLLKMHRFVHGFSGFFGELFVFLLHDFLQQSLRRLLSSKMAFRKIRIQAQMFSEVLFGLLRNFLLLRKIHRK